MILVVVLEFSQMRLSGLKTLLNTVNCVKCQFYLYTVFEIYVVAVAMVVSTNKV